jgi:undecaprenyl-diphosphatase
VVAAFVLVEGVLLALGLLVSRVLDDGPLHRQEIAVVRLIEAHRTAFWNDVTGFGTVLGSTWTIVGLTAVGCILLARRGQGPRLPAFLAVAVAGETLLFLLTSSILDRLRPAITQLEVAPETSSFPSGHTAATIALGCGLALGMARTHPRHRLRALSWGLAVTVAAFVLASRLYRGMHWPTDVAASVVFTLLWLLLLRAVLLPPTAADRPPDRGAGEAPAASPVEPPDGRGPERSHHRGR